MVQRWVILVVKITASTGSEEKAFIAMNRESGNLSMAREEVVGRGDIHDLRIPMR